MIQAVLPWPPSNLRPNAARRRHWTQNAKDAAAYKYLCAMELRAQGVGKLPVDRVALSIVFHPPTRRAVDLDGSLSAIKALLDALSVAVGIDDQHFRPITLDSGEVVKGGRVVVSIAERW